MLNKINIKEDIKTKQLDQKILQDYYRFFSLNEDIDMLSYAYMASSDLYDGLLKYNTDYYLFREEVDLIKNHKAKFNEILAKITHIVEVGPGSSHVIKHKTLPILGYAKDLKKYSMIDISQNYLAEACRFIQSKRLDIKVSGKVADLLQKEPITLDESKEQKALMFLGSTIGNFDQAQQLHIIKHLANLTNINDILILGVDTNMNPTSLLNAYSTNFIQGFLRGVLIFYATINHDFAQYLYDFDVVSSWDEVNKVVDIDFIARKNISFNFDAVRKIHIKAGQILRRRITSRKFDQQLITNLVDTKKFKLIDKLQQNNMVMFIFKRVKPQCLPG